MSNEDINNAPKANKKGMHIFHWMVGTRVGLIFTALWVVPFLGPYALAAAAMVPFGLGVPLIGAYVGYVFLNPAYKKCQKWAELRSAAFTVDTKGSSKGFATINIFDGRTRVMGSDLALKPEMQTLLSLKASTAEKGLAAVALGQIGMPPVLKNDKGNVIGTTVTPTEKLMLDNGIQLPGERKNILTLVRDFFGPPNQNINLDFNWKNRKVNPWNQAKKVAWDYLGENLKFRYFITAFPKMTPYEAATRVFGDGAVLYVDQDNGYAIEGANRDFHFLSNGNSKNLEAIYSSGKERLLRNAGDKSTDVFIRPMAVYAKNFKLRSSVVSELKGRSIALQGEDNEGRYTNDVANNMVLLDFAGRNFPRYFALPNLDRPDGLEICYTVTRGNRAQVPFAGGTPVLFPPPENMYLWTKSVKDMNANQFLCEYQKWLQKEIIDTGKNQFPVKDAIDIYKFVLDGMYMNDSAYAEKGSVNRNAAQELIGILNNLYTLERKSGSDTLVTIPVTLTDTIQAKANVDAAIKTSKPLSSDSEKLTILFKQILECRDSSLWARNNEAEGFGAPGDIGVIKNASDPRNDITQNRALFEMRQLWHSIGKSGRSAIGTQAAKDLARGDDRLANAFSMAREVSDVKMPVELQRQNDSIMQLTKESRGFALRKRKVGSLDAAEALQPKPWRERVINPKDFGLKL